MSGDFPVEAAKPDLVQLSELKSGTKFVFDNFVPHRGRDEHMVISVPYISIDDYRHGVHVLNLRTGIAELLARQAQVILVP